MIQVLVQSGSNIVVEIVNTKLGLCLVKKKNGSILAVF
jgi:hypothetical protein